MTGVVLNRSFWPLGDGDDYEPDFLRSQELFGSKKMVWEDLLLLKRTVVLAEAGAGKTYELKQAAKSLRAQKKYAFFCRIEDLGEPSLDDALAEGTKEEITRWLKGGDEAWFFLDSVDEARLTSPKLFELALRRLARIIIGAEIRTHVILSARVSDWRASADLALVREIIPCISSDSGDEDAGEDDDGDEERSDGVKPQTQKDEISVVQLAPLSYDQMSGFALAQGVADVSNFMETIAHADAGIFAERPLDLIELIGFWKRYGRIGSHGEMIEFNVKNKLLEPNPDRDEHRPLSPARAMFGAEYIAAGLTFTRRNSIVLPDRPVDPERAAQSLDPKDLLPQWDASEIQTLLGRPLFDEATYGRVRFHHRTVREYLTAHWLHRLLSKGKHRRAIENLIFAKRYGITFAVRSMRPVAAWLALFDPGILQKMMVVAPDVLIAYGDPSKLSIDIRAQLLTKFAEMGLDQRGFDDSFDVVAVRRFADPQLWQTINKLLQNFRSNEDVRQLLLRVVWQGKISASAKISLSFAVDPSMDRYTRNVAIRAVGAAGNVREKQYLAKALLDVTQEKDWHCVAEACLALFPDIIGINDVIAVIKAAAPPAEFATHPLSSALQEIIEERCSPQQWHLLLQKLVELISQEQKVERDEDEMEQQYSWLFSHLKDLCQRLLSNNHVDGYDETILRALELRFRGHYYGHRRDADLDHLISIVPDLNHNLFWRAIHRTRASYSAEGKRLTDFWPVMYPTPAFKLTVDDFEYFLEQIRAAEVADDSFVAVSVAFKVWQEAGRSRKGRDALRRQVRGSAELERALHSLLHPGKMPNYLKRHRRLDRKYELEQAQRKKQAEIYRQNWIDKVKSSASALRDVRRETVDAIFPHLYDLAMEIEERPRKEPGKWEKLVEDFGCEVAAAVRDGLIEYWRLYSPSLVSENHTTSTSGTRVGLVGIAIEDRERPDWAYRLTRQESEIALRYAASEIPFPSWAEKIFDLYPDVSDELIGKEIFWEFEAVAGSRPYHVLAALQYERHGKLRKRYAYLVLTMLQKFEPANDETLEAALSIVLRTADTDKQRLGALAETRFRDAVNESRKLTWLTVWMCTEAEGAISALQSWVEDAPDEAEADGRMITFCNAIIPHHHVRFHSHFRDFERVEILRKLIPLIYRYVRREDDVRHEGSYTPDARDGAESARNFFLSQLCETKGRDAFEGLLHLSQVLSCKESKDRMVALAHRRAADDAEMEVWNAADAYTFAELAEKPPGTPHQLFTLICHRLDDLRMDVEEGDASEGKILQLVRAETDFRTWFANRLRERARGFYSIPPEEELADATRPDLRVHAPSIDAPVAIELKIADKWSHSELVERLQNQLVKQYLRDARSRYGIFLLVRQGKKGLWKDRRGQKDLTFREVVENLQQHAHALTSSVDVDGLSVIGIDLTKRQQRGT